MNEHELFYNNLDLLVIGTYHKSYPATYEHPGDPEEFDIYSIEDENSQDITDDFNQDELNEIEELILEQNYR